jgi:hypothetical protein
MQDLSQPEFETVVLNDAKGLLERLFRIAELCLLAPCDTLTQQHFTFAAWHIQPPVNPQALVE